MRAAALTEEKLTLAKTVHINVANEKYTYMTIMMMIFVSAALKILTCVC